VKDERKRQPTYSVEVGQLLVIVGSQDENFWFVSESNINTQKNCSLMLIKDYIILWMILKKFIF